MKDVLIARTYGCPVHNFGWDPKERSCSCQPEVFRADNPEDPRGQFSVVISGENLSQAKIDQAWEKWKR